jgi:hypothetical protein
LTGFSNSRGLEAVGSLELIDICAGQRHCGGPDQLDLSLSVEVIQVD